MLKKLILENWKSFRYAELPIDPLTVLIGTNASGKSNANDALEFLSRIAQGKSLRASLIGEPSYSSIRGGAEWASLKPITQFTLKALVKGHKENTDYLYSITVETTPKIRLLTESLIEISYAEKIEIHHSETEELTEKIELFQVDYLEADSSKVEVTLFNDKWTPNDEYFGDLIFHSDRSYSQLKVITSLPGETYTKATSAFQAAATVLAILRGICVLNPVPSNMRFYSLLFDGLQKDASNIAGVLAALDEKEKTYVESILTSYVAHLPERDIQRVWAEPVGRLNSDAMLYCEESWIPGEPPLVVDARGMSDGTLRFIAIVTALLTQPEGSQLVIEEVDNGLHPSRAELLLKMLRELGEKRKIDILVTTHNPALLNALQPEMIPFVVVAHRDGQTGESKLTPLDNIQRLPKLLASGHIGDLATQGAIEKSLSQ
jgi:predicted ATPase